ncbi:MAG TPA: glycosyltransferase family 2 protein [Gemmatimonadaceae bacterium]|nr:glycosyltransferase family 2 protein [Gemmatimonadaceae bacterium]
MNGQPTLSVVIPTRGRADVLRHTLDALLRQTLDLSCAEILVVVDGDDPATCALVHALADGAPCPLVALSQRRQGPAIARNTGIARASGRVVLMLDDDITASRTLLAAHVRHHAGRDDAMVVGPLPMERIENEPAHHRLTRRWWDEEIREVLSPWHRPVFRDFVTGNVSVVRERLCDTGGFDADFTGYGREDYELGYRLLQAGLHFVFEPDAAGLHRYRKPVGEWLRQFESMAQADVIFARKHPEITGAIMNLSPFPVIRWNPGAVAAGEALVGHLNQRGGLAWKKAAGYVNASYYWHGIRTAVRDRAELGSLLRARLAARSRTGNLGFKGMLYLKRAQWGLR